MDKGVKKPGSPRKKPSPKDGGIVGNYPEFPKKTGDETLDFKDGGSIFTKTGIGKDGVLTL